MSRTRYKSGCNLGTRRKISNAPVAKINENKKDEVLNFNYMVPTEKGAVHACRFLHGVGTCAFGNRC